MTRGTVPQNTHDPVNDSPTSMRTSMTRGYGATPAYIHEGRVVDVNFVNWTVSVWSQFDMRYWPDIQVASPYLHPSRGEGIYVMPEVNSKVLVCIPSDGPPPFVIGFIASMERSGRDTVQGDAEGEGDDNTDSAGGMGGSTYALGRKRAKPGDIFMRGRDGNFMILHRGGVLQIGATDIAQRIYIPLRNLVTDISQNYEHFNSGGSINWGISVGETSDNPETEWRQVFRLYANDERADIRVAAGKVHQPLPEPAAPDGSQSDLSALNIGGDNTVVYEFDIAPGGFNAETGAPVGDVSSKMKLFFDRAGGGFLRAEGSVLVRVKKKLKVVADEGIEFETNESVSVRAAKGMRLTDTLSFVIGTDGGILSMNSGKDAVAHVGSVVEVTISVPAIAQALADPTATSIQAAGSVTTGRTKTLV